MRATLAVALAALAALAACSSDYVLSTKTGAMVETTNKPYLDESKEEVVEILDR